MPLKKRTGSLKPTQVKTFFEKRLKKRRMAFKNGEWSKLTTKDKAFVIAESFKQSHAKAYSPQYVQGILMPLVKQHPVKFASGLGRSNTQFFFEGLGKNIEPFFKMLGADTGKFVKRLYYKNQLASGAFAGQLGNGLSKNISSFLSGLSKEGLKRFDNTLQRQDKRKFFIVGLGKNAQTYLDAVHRARNVR